jgi:antitoxin component YwqK of YwqJK toxin-antitoxin module
MIRARVSLLAVLAVTISAGCALTSQRDDLAACPAGSSRKEASNPEKLVWCEDAHHAKQGPSVLYHRNGVVWTRGENRDGKQEGWWRVWDEEGVLVRETELENGIEIARRRVAKDGPPRASVPGDPVHPCPDGTVVGGAAPPEGREEWCESPRPDGAYVRDGAWLNWYSEKSGGGIWHRGAYHDGKRAGAFETFRANGTSETKRTFADKPLPDSSATYPNGQKRYEARLGEDGLETRTRWRSNGAVQSVEVLRGKEYVHKTYWFHNGQKSSDEEWKAGKRDGTQRTWWPNGKLHTEGEKAHGTDIGAQRVFGPDGVLLETSTRGPHGLVTRRSELIRKGDPTDWPLARVAPSPTPKRVGERECPSPAQPFLEKRPTYTAAGCFVGSEGPGLVLDLAPFFTKEEEPRVTAKHGTLHGPLRIWDEDGHQVAQIGYRDGKYDGPMVTWRPDGSLRRIETFAAGEKDGAFASWTRNGAPQGCGSYRKGKQDGVW